MRLLGRKLTLEQLRLLADGTEVYVDEGEENDGFFESGISIKKNNKIIDSSGLYYTLDNSRSIESGEVKVYELAETDEMKKITFEQASELEDGTVVFADDESKSLSGCYTKKGNRLENPYGTNGYCLDRYCKDNLYTGRKVNLYISKIKKEEIEMKFKVGDKVKALVTVGGNYVENATGVVIEIEEDDVQPCLVKFNEEIDGHGEDNRCWWMEESEIELIKESQKPSYNTPLKTKACAEKHGFSIGDRIKVVEDGDLKGEIGTVIDFWCDTIGIAFDKPIGMHNCSLGDNRNSCVSGYGQWFKPHKIETIKDSKATPVFEKEDFKPSYNTPLKSNVCAEKDGFVIGDRIKAKSNGEIGTVIDFVDDSNDGIGVAFDNPIGSHTCSIGNNGNHCDIKHGRWFEPSEIELISGIRGLRTTTPIFDEPVVNDVEITVKGRKITASYKGFVGVSRCNPEDDFNESYGIGLALERLGAEIKAQGEKEIKEIEESKIPTLDIDSYREFLDGKVGVKFESFDDMREFLKKLDGIVKWKDGENANGYVPRILTNLIYVHKDFKVLLNDREEYCKERFNLKVVKYK